MIITCPSCQTSYQLSQGALGEEGRKVKCAKCGHRWAARPENAASALAQPGGDARDEGAGDRHGPALPDGDDWAGAPGGEDWAGAPGGEDASDHGGLFDVARSAAEDAATLPVEDEDATEALVDAEEPAPAGVDIESLAALTGGRDGKAGRARARAARLLRRRGPRGERSGSGRAARYAATAGCLVLVAGGVLLMRHQVVAALPGTAGLYASVGLPVNLRGLEFRNVTFEHTFENGLPVLAIWGEVVNIAGRAVIVPDIRYGLSDEMNNEIYSWTGRAQAEEIAADRTAMFMTRLQSPPGKAVKAMVRFSGPRGGRS